MATLSPVASSANRAPARPNAASILLVDDQPANLLTLEAVLDPLHQRLVRARSGEEALSLLQREDFAAILLDVQMPGLDGFQTAARIREHAGDRRVPILFMSAVERDAAEALRGYELGAADFLTKPFDPAVLRAKVALFVELHLAREEARRHAAAEESARAEGRLSEILLRKTREAEAEQTRRARQALLGADVGVALTRPGPLREVLQRCTEAVVRHLDAAFARIWTLDASGTTLELQSSSGMYTHTDGGHARVPVGSFKIGKIAEEKRPHLTNDVLNDPRVGDRAWAAREGMVAFAGFPLLVEDRLAGVVALFAKQVLPEDTLTALAAVADTIALGIQRKRAEEALRASEHRYAQILDSVQEMVFCKAEGSMVTYANKATCEHYGLTAAQLRGATDVPSNQVDYTQQDLRDDRKVFETGVTVEVLEEPNVRADGETRFFHTVKTPVRDTEGRVVEIVGVSRDITDRKRVEDQQRFLAEASTLLASSLDYETTLANVTRLAVPSIGDWCSVHIVDPDGTVRQLAVAHVDPSKVQFARELNERFPPDPDAPTGVHHVIRAGQPEVFREIPDALLEAVIKDPEQLRLTRELGLRSAMTVPLIARDRVLGAISLVTAESRRLYTDADLALAQQLAQRAAIAVDNARLYAEAHALVQERDAALARVERANATLEERVRERTAQLTEANNELEAFSYTVSHDLRAPIRHMSGFVDLLQRHAGDKLDEKSARYVRVIGESAKQMGTLIDALLAFSRIGRAEMARARVDLDALLRDVLRGLEPDTAGRKIEWQLAKLPAAQGDPTLLRLVLSNLVGNAVKYTRTREQARIEVGTHVGDDPREQVFFVRDNGVGFNPAYTNKLFGVFQRLHTDAQFDGTGIGLASVRRIVQRHGGRVWADGAPDAGATFYFTLPRTEEGPA